MTSHTNFGEFDCSKEDWPAYTERLEFYLEANEIEGEDKRRAVLLSACGASTFSLMKSIAAPRKLNEVPYKDIVKLVADHLSPKPSVAVSRYKFNSRTRQPSESVNSYVAELKRLAENCDFGSTDALNSMLRDRLVCGIGDSRMRRRILAEPALDFDKALQLVTAMELADRSDRDLQESGVATGVNSVHWLSSTRRDKKNGLGSRMPLAESCSRCGGRHSAVTCKFKNADCFHCRKRGHIARACRNKKKESTHSAKKPSHRTHRMSELEQPQPVAEEPVYSLFQLSARSTNPIRVTVGAQGKDLLMEVDTGASLSLMSESTYRSTWSDTERPLLQPSQVKLRTYTGEIIGSKGVITVPVSHNGQHLDLSLQVLSGDGPTLMGRDWLRVLKLDWPTLFTLNHLSSLSLQAVLDRHTAVFKEELGTVKGLEVKLHLKPDATPRFHRSRSVPYSMKAKVEAELERLERQGVIEPVLFSQWAAPIVPVLKSDGNVRICGDYKLTINRESERDKYPLPKVEDLFSTLSGGKAFTKLDMAHAYQQLVLEESSREYTTINTAKGLFRYKRLPFGIASAPSIFQRTLENVLQGIPNVCVYLDDVLVTGSTEASHLRNLEAVLSKMESAGVRLKKEKCTFLLPAVEYLGHKISKQGLHPSAEKTRAIKEAPTPCNVTQLKSFLGLVNYYGKFIPNVSTLLAPLYSLLQKQTTWSWGPAQQQAFEAAKEQLSSDSVLAHYNPCQELILACDASSYGVGAVLSHRMGDGSDKPVAYVSRSLSPAEKRYSQLDREALALIFGVTKFRQYLIG